jgi:hypothetical protein
MPPLFGSVWFIQQPLVSYLRKILRSALGAFGWRSSDLRCSNNPESCVPAFQALVALLAERYKAHFLAFGFFFGLGFLAP